MMMNTRFGLLPIAVLHIDILRPKEQVEMD